MQFLFYQNLSHQNNFGIILAQLWRFDDDGHLKNKLRDWSHSESISQIVPKNLSEGYIEIKRINKFFTLDPKRKVVSFQNKDVSDNVNQKWKFGEEDSEGWRTIEHSNSGLYLTTRYKNKGTSMTVENKGRLNIFRNKLFSS